MRLSAAFVILVLVASPVLAAVPATRMMKHCMETGLPCHDQNVLSCCSTAPIDAAPPATPVATGAVSGAASGPSQHVVAVISASDSPGFAPANPSPPHGYQSGNVLSRLSTLLI